MNKKANKSQLQWPPLLNLSDDKPHIDTSFQNWEKVNGPYLNSMIQPVYTKSDNRKTIYSKNGKQFYVEDNYLHIDGHIDPTFNEIENKKFVRNKLDFSKNVIAAAYLDGDYCTVQSNPNNTISFYKGYSLLSTHNIGPSIVDCRFIGNLFIIVYSSGSVYYVKAFNVQSDVTEYGPLTVNWYTCNRTDVYGDYVWSQPTQLLNQPKADCIITGYVDYSASVDDESEQTCYYITLTSNYGEVEDTYTNGFFTFIVCPSLNAIRRIERFELPKSTERIASQQIQKTVFVTTTASNTDTTKLFLSSDGNTYYDYIQNTTSPKGAQYNFPTGVIPSYTNRSITIDEGTAETPRLVTYRVYSISISARKRTATIVGDASDTFTDFNWRIANDVPLDQITIDEGTLVDRCISNSGQGKVSISYTLTQYNTQASIIAGWDNETYIFFTYGGSTKSIDPKIHVNSPNGYTFNVNTQYTSLGHSSTMPVIAMDDQKFYALWSFNVNTNTAVDQNQQWGNTALSESVSLICQSAEIYYVDGSTLRFRHQVTNTDQYSNGCIYPRSNSFVIDQGLFVMTAKFNNSAASNPRTLVNSGKEQAGSMFSEWTYNNRYGFRYFPGTSRQNSFNYYSQAVTGDPSLTGTSEDSLVYTVAGYRVPLYANLFALYNVTSSGFAYIQGISYANSNNELGTLLTPWESIDETSYISASYNRVIYRDKAKDWYEIIIQGGNELTTLLEDRYVLINTTSYLNLYDSETDKWYHYASDYNGRLFHGQNSQGALSGVLATSSSNFSAYPYMRYTANGINPMYQVMPRDPISSIILPITPRYRCGIKAEQLYDCVTPNYNNLQGVDVFWSEYASTVCRYRMTLNQLLGTLQSYAKSELAGLTYPGTTSSSATLTPNMFTKYIDGAGNNDIVVENYDSYVLTYYDNKPYFIYSAATQVSTTYGERDAFFVLQGQFYGVIGDKLYSLIYSNGAISQMDAIIDVKGLTFLGNTPMIAFFYDSAHRVIKSFTGDANLSTLYNATKVYGITGKHFYDTETQSIYIPTSNGLFVIGPRNMYLFEQWKDVSLVQFDGNGITHITNGDETISLVYYKSDGYDLLPLDLESSFYGYGATENISIDRWNITLYDLDGTHPESYITVGVRSITDVTVKTEEKTIKITPNMYDKWSNSVFIAFNPSIIKGQGLRIYIKTPLVVQSVIAHVMDNGTGTLTRHNV